MALFAGERDISLFRSINRELINDIIDTKVDIVKAAIKDIKEIIGLDLSSLINENPYGYKKPPKLIIK